MSGWMKCISCNGSRTVGGLGRNKRVCPECEGTGQGFYGKDSPKNKEYNRETKKWVKK